MTWWALIVVCAAAIAFLIISTPIAPPLSDQEVRDILQGEIGPVDILNVTFENPCSCTTSECTTLCWNVSVVKNNQNLTVVITPKKDVIVLGGGGGGGGGGGSGGSDSPTPPPVYECNITTVDNSGDPAITWTNTGCRNPTPTCEPDDRTCRRCLSSVDCIRTTDFSYSNGEHVTNYVLIGTVFQGNYTVSTSNCLLEDDIIVIADNTTTQAECTALVESHSTCSDQGVCKFI